MDQTSKTSAAAAVDQNTLQCREALVVALRNGDSTALKKFCCVNFGTWNNDAVLKHMQSLVQQGIIESVPKFDTKIDICDGSDIWSLARTNAEAFSPILQHLINNADFSQGCNCSTGEESNCCDNAGTFAGLGLAAAIVFERIEMGKKVRGENNKHGLALGLVLGIILLMIITNIGSSLSGVWLLALGAVIFVGMSLIQGKFMQQYSLNRQAKFEDFSSDTSENVVEQAFFTTSKDGFAL